jgi:hypothetical protein
MSRTSAVTRVVTDVDVAGRKYVFPNNLQLNELQVKVSHWSGKVEWIKWTSELVWRQKRRGGAFVIIRINLAADWKLNEGEGEAATGGHCFDSPWLLMLLRRKSSRQSSLTIHSPTHTHGDLIMDGSHRFSNPRTGKYFWFIILFGRNCDFVSFHPTRAPRSLIPPTLDPSSGPTARDIWMKFVGCCRRGPGRCNVENLKSVRWLAAEIQTLEVAGRRKFVSNSVNFGRVLWRNGSR